MKAVVSSRVTVEGAWPSLASEIKKALTLDNPAYTEAVQRGRWTGNIPHKLKFWEQEGKNLIIPRGAVSIFHRLATDAGRVPDYEDHRLSLDPLSLEFQAELRPYQEKAVLAVLRTSYGVLQAGTGAGKTVMALFVIAQRQQPTLILVHNKELMNQWADRAKQFLGVDVGRIGGGKFEIRPITVGIINTVRNRLEALQGHFGHVVVDECHRCPSAMFSVCVQALDAKFLLGLSATPYRRDGLTRVMHFYLGSVVHEVDPGELRDVGAILTPEVVTRWTNFHFDKDAAENYQEMMTALTEDRSRNIQIAGDVVRELKESSGALLVVSDRVGHLEALQSILAEHGHEMPLLTGKTSAKKREQIVADVRAGKIRIMGSTIQLIGEGFDCPGLASLFLATPIKFSGRLIQVVGRILRPQDGKRPRLYDYRDPVGVLEASAKARAAVYKRLAA